MRIDCGPTQAEKLAASRKWHPVFLWWPKRFGSHDCRWLETVERCWKVHTTDIVVATKYLIAGIPNGFWEYRARGDAA